MDMVPYYNEDVVLYMDDLTGTNVVLQPRTHGLGKTAGNTGGTAAGTSRTPRADPNAATLLDNSTNPQQRNAGLAARGRTEVDDLLAGDKRGGADRYSPEGRRTEDSGSPTSRFPRPRFPFDVNIYQQKKTLAQGMMDLALISANANQFRYVMQSSSHPYYLTSLSMIGTSLFLQIVVGIGLIWNSKYNVKKDDHATQANKVNNLTVIGIFLVTILNVFITSFGVAEPGNVAAIANAIKLSDDVPDVETLPEN